jgi:putative transposase
LNEKKTKYNKTYKVQLYPTKEQAKLMDTTFSCNRFLWNQIKAEHDEIYEKLKNDKDKLYTHKYKTEKEYKEEFPFLCEVPSRTLQQTRIDFKQAQQNTFRRIRQGKKPGFPKFKKKSVCKDSYREPQVGNQVRVEENNTRLVLPKMKQVKIKGLSKNFEGKIKSVTVSKSKSGKYFASILVEMENKITKERKSDNILGIDLGLKEFATCSNGEIITGIKEKMELLDKRVRQQNKHLSRKKRGSSRYEKCRIQLNRLYDKRQNYLNHFQWHLANKLASENQVVSLENLNVAGMKQNRKLSRAIHNVNWSSFVVKLEQKAKEYDTEIYRINRFFPSSKMCSRCGMIKDDLKLSDRNYRCDCGLEIDRDLNAAINIKKNYLVNKKSLEYSDYNKRGEIIRPRHLIYQSQGGFIEAFTNNIESNTFL